MMPRVAALILKGSKSMSSSTMTDIEVQCQLAANVISSKDTIPSQLMPDTFKYFLMFVCVIVLYPAFVFIIGYKFGYKNGQRRKRDKRVTSGKSTMTPVTYTFVRGVKEPRFEFNPSPGGCWQ